MRKDAIVPGPKIVERYPSPIHYRPAAGRLADTIPFFWKGDYHIFYLRALDKVPWEHIVSRDLVHWQELPTALRSDGAKDGPDGLHMFTGSVSEHDGTFHIWYTGWNPENKAGRERISHATSPDLLTWTKHPEDGFFGDGVHYDNSDFRDPFVFWNDAEKKLWMVVCARDAKTKHPVQGVLTSDDDAHWTQSEPLKLDPPLGEGTPECPDVFQVGDTWHLIHSPSAGTTDMRYAAEVGGPYKVPETGSIDTPILYAAKRMFDGKRHVITGWIRDLGGERDGGDMQWGGDQSVPREVYAGPNGMLYFKPVPEALAVFDKTVSALEKPAALMDGKQPMPFLLQTPDNYLLECIVKMDAEAVLHLNMRSGEKKDSGYHLVLRPEKREAEIYGAKFKYSRTATIDTSQPVKIQAFVLGSIIECFINDAYAFSCRAYDWRKGPGAIAVSGGNATVESCMIRVPSKESAS
jgi:sucrose-6-phosphate hydrolase SacC (GH32 family)